MQLIIYEKLSFHVFFNDCSLLGAINYRYWWLYYVDEGCFVMHLSCNTSRYSRYALIKLWCLCPKKTKKQKNKSSLFFNGWYGNFLLESFNLWCSLLIIVFYHHTKTLISFWCRQGLNSRSLIQPSEIYQLK